MQTLARSMAVLTLGAAFVATPLDLRAQECTATITPAQVQAGQQAVRLNVSFSEDVGELTRLQAADSGIALAEAGDLPRTDLAANAPAPRPIAMAQGQEDTWTVYVNTEDARPGSHVITFVAAEGGCTAQLSVQAAGQPGAPGAQPGQPGAQPGRQPGAQPGQPSQPGQPGAQPGRQPGAQPGQPSQPGQPGAQPGRQPGAQPGAQPGQPSQPGAQPGQPSQPGQPGAQPGRQPGAQPGAQPGQPSQPGAGQPGAQPGTQPTQPGTQPRPGN
jgi:hypothetical protein